VTTQVDGGSPSWTAQQSPVEIKVGSPSETEMLSSQA